MRTRTWEEHAVACPDCGTVVTYRMDYTPRGWMDEGGYWPSECDTPGHKVMQPTRMDRRTGAEQLVCDTAAGNP